MDFLQGTPSQEFAAARIWPDPLGPGRILVTKTAVPASTWSHWLDFRVDLKSLSSVSIYFSSIFARNGIMINLVLRLYWQRPGQVLKNWTWSNSVVDGTPPRNMAGFVWYSMVRAHPLLGDKTIEHIESNIDCNESANRAKILWGLLNCYLWFHQHLVASC